MASRERPSAALARVVLAYAVVALAWIVLSDLVVDWLGLTGTVVQTMKGIGFVVVAAAMLYFVLRRWETRAAEAEDSFTRVRALFETLFDGLDDAVLLVGADRRVLACNGAVERLTGHPPESLLGRATRILHVDEAAFEAFGELSASALADQGVFRSEFQLRHADGHVLDTEHTVAVIGAEQPVCLSIVRDITASKRTIEAMSRERLRLESLLANVTDAVTVLDDEDRIVFASQSASRITGRRREALLGESALDLIHPEDLERTLEALGAVREAPGAVRGVAHRVRHCDGHWVEAESVGVLPVGADVLGVVLSTRDVSPQREAERKLRDKDEQLRHAQKMEAIGRLAGGVAHDFNNLLTVIFSYASFLEEGLDRESPLQRDLAAIMEAAQQAARLTEQLLLLSRHQASHPTAIDLNALLEELEKVLQRLVGEDVELRFEKAEGVPTVFLEKGRLVQVLMNLVGNARDAMPMGGVLTISASTRTIDGEEASSAGQAPGRYARLSISDTGTGIEPETMSRLFEPFFTTKAEGQGTGLGLATSFAIIQQAGGFIEVEARPGEGARFHVHLPEGVDRRVAPRLPELRVEEPQRGARILLVEDDAPVRAATRRLLERGGHEVVDAPSGSGALALSEGGHFDLLISDVVMPGMSGPELADRLAEAGVCDRVLFLSGYAPEELRRREGHRVHALLLAKPFTQVQLLEEVRHALELRDSESEAS